MKRLPDTAHTSRPWRIHEIVPDFRLEDVWDLPGRGGPDDFSRVVELIASFDPAQSSSRIARALWATRWKVGALLGWDDPEGGLGSRVASLYERLPADLVRRGRGPDFAALPFTPLYLTRDEFAAEIANKTMHGVMHVSAIEEDLGCYRAQAAVLVRPNGRLGTAYMAAIKPFRNLIVYPALMKDGRELWERERGGTARDTEASLADHEDRQPVAAC
jgi:Protein of unknown function (DUF2867)